MILSHDRRLIFIKTQKTAGSSLELSLSQICGPTDIITPLMPEEEQQLRKGRAPQNYIRDLGAPRKLRPDGYPKVDLDLDFYNHLPARKVRDYVGPTLWKRYLKAGFVRNPWDRAVSTFHWRMRKQADKSPAAFKRFLVESEADRLPLWDLISIDDALALDFVGRYETLAEDFARLLAEIGYKKPLPIGRAKTETRSAAARDYRLFYDDDSRAMIAQGAAREIEAFGYSF